MKKQNKMDRFVTIVFVIFLASLALSVMPGCFNTISGIGADLQSFGDGMKDRYGSESRKER